MMFYIKILNVNVYTFITSTYTKGEVALLYSIIRVEYIIVNFWIE